VGFLIHTLRCSDAISKFAFSALRRAAVFFEAGQARVFMRGCDFSRERCYLMLDYNWSSGSYDTT
jgi:hypothetical protein